MIVPREETNVVPNAGALDLTPRQTDAPNAGDVISAAFRQENPIVSFFSQHRAGGDRDPSHNPWTEIQGTPYEAHWDRFSASFNAGQTAALKQQIDMELADRRTLAASGGWGMLAGMGASVLSPDVLLPGGTIYRGVRTGQAALRTAMSTAGATALSTSMAEMGLLATQELRTPQEAAVNVGMSAILGGVLGGSISGVFSGGDWLRLSRGMDDEAIAANDMRLLEENENAVLAGIKSSDAGAMARRVPTLGENTIAGRAAATVGAATAQLNPVLRALHSASPVFRDIATRLFENPIYVKANLAGETSGPAVETMVKQYQGSLARGLEQFTAAYGEHRKAGGQLSRAEFSEAVSRAMRRADRSSDPAVAKAAQAWRSSLFDAGKEEAIKLGMLPADVSVETASSYLTRMYNRPLIEAREQEFKAIVRKWLDQEVRNAQIRFDNGKLDPRYATDVRPPEFLNDADRAGYVNEITDAVFNKITGREFDMDMPRDLVVTDRGPLAQRTFSIPDHMIEPFLESDIEVIARRYARVMGADIELTRQFGSVDLADQIKDIKTDYAKLRAAVQAGVDPETGAPLPKKLTAKQREAEIKRLSQREKSDLADLKALRDMIRGTHLAELQGKIGTRAMRVAGTFNFIRSLGGVALSSVGDVGRHLMVHAFAQDGGVLRDGLLPLIRNVKGIRMAAGEAKLAGTVLERVLNTRLATMAELTDPYSSRSPFEAFMDNSATVFSKLTLLDQWTDFNKSLAATMTQNRVLRGSGNYTGLTKKERAYLAYLGIDGSMAERIARQFEAHGLEDGGVRVANSEEWTDDVARRTFRAAIAKDVDTTIVTKGVGDIPLWMNTPAGKLVGQFKSFALASHQRVLMRGLQERQAAMVSGVIFSMMAGMLAYALKSIESNRMDDISDNPGRWIAEGLDRSGIFSIAFEVNNTIEKALGVGAYGALAAAFPDASQEGTASRYAMRSTAAAFTGPTGDLIDTAVRAVQAIKGSGDGLSEGDVNSIRRLLPYATLPGIRSLIEWVGVPAVTGK